MMSSGIGRSPLCDPHFTSTIEDGLTDLWTDTFQFLTWHKDRHVDLKLYMSTPSQSGSLFKGVSHFWHSVSWDHFNSR